MIRWRFSVMFSRRFAVMSFRLMLFALCSVLHKVSSVPQGISDKKHNFVLCRAIFYLCGNRFCFLCFVISYKKAQKKPPGNKGVLPLYRAACCAITNFLFGKLYLVLFCFSLFDFGLCDNYFLILFNPFDACSQVFGNKADRGVGAVVYDFRSNIICFYLSEYLCVFFTFISYF